MDFSDYNPEEVARSFFGGFGSSNIQFPNPAFSGTFGRIKGQNVISNYTGNKQPAFSLSGMYKDPFGTAMSGTQTGTLQPYINRMTQNASNALYGGLLGYSPRSMIAGDAGGTPVNSTVPQFNIPSALGQYGNGLNFTGFGNRSWMGGGNGTA